MPTNVTLLPNTSQFLYESYCKWELMTSYATAQCVWSSISKSHNYFHDSLIFRSSFLLIQDLSRIRKREKKSSHLRSWNWQIFGIFAWKKKQIDMSVFKMRADKLPVVKLIDQPNYCCVICSFWRVAGSSHIPT